MIPKPTYQRLFNISLETKSPDEFFDRLLELRSITLDFPFESFYQNSPKKLVEFDQGCKSFYDDLSYWEDSVHKAWEYLGRDYYRFRALEYLQHSVEEFIDYGYASVALRARASGKRKRELQVRSLQDLSQQAFQAIGDSKVIINKYLDGAKTLGTSPQLCEDIVKSWDSIQKQLSHLSEGISKGTLQKRGRKGKPILNATILELEAMFLERLSGHKAQEYTNILLHVTGLRSNSCARGLSAKISQLLEHFGGRRPFMFWGTPHQIEKIETAIKKAMIEIGSDDRMVAFAHICILYTAKHLAKRVPTIENDSDDDTIAGIRSVLAEFPALRQYWEKRAQMIEIGSDDRMVAFACRLLAESPGVQIPK